MILSHNDLSSLCGRDIDRRKLILALIRPETGIDKATLSWMEALTKEVFPAFKTRLREDHSCV